MSRLCDEAWAHRHGKKSVLASHLHKSGQFDNMMTSRKTLFLGCAYICVKIDISRLRVGWFLRSFHVGQSRASARNYWRWLTLFLLRLPKPTWQSRLRAIGKKLTIIMNRWCLLCKILFMYVVMQCVACNSAHTVEDQSDPLTDDVVVSLWEGEEKGYSRELHSLYDLA